MTDSPQPAAAIAAYLRANLGRSPHADRVGPFVCGFDTQSDNPFRNYAFPDDGCAPSHQDMTSLIEAFERRSRRPRLEYLPDLAPALAATLYRHGFGLEAEPPLMICRLAALRPAPAPAAITLGLATSEADLALCAQVQNQAYGQDETTSADVARLVALVERGGAVALARDKASGDGVGSGLFSAPLHGVTEVAAIGVVTGCRRRGVGAAVTALLAETAFRRGLTTPFLMAAHDAEARLYSRIGFEVCGRMRLISRP